MKPTKKLHLKHTSDNLQHAGDYREVARYRAGVLPGVCVPEKRTPSRPVDSQIHDCGFPGADAGRLRGVCHSSCRFAELQTRAVCDSGDHCGWAGTAGQVSRIGSCACVKCGSSAEEEAGRKRSTNPLCPEQSIQSFGRRLSDRLPSPVRMAWAVSLMRAATWHCIAGFQYPSGGN